MLTKTFRRHLPHILPAGSTIFLTWRLRGSLPPGFVFDIPDQRELSDGVSFGKMDKLLDTATQGPRWLADSAIAEEVCRTIERGAEAPLFQYVLHEYVVMPNHVHLLISPRTDVSRIMQGIKGTTARFANLQLGRTGEFFGRTRCLIDFAGAPKSSSAFVDTSPGIQCAPGWPKQWMNGRGRARIGGGLISEGTPH